jgi:sugar/nucleoside kinase (ribokinase family)
MLDYIVYGKIIIDNIKLLDGNIIENQLGGGGPQGAFGVRVWSDSVGLISRLGKTFPETARKELEKINIDTEGVNTYTDLETLFGTMFYDENDYLNIDDRETSTRLNKLEANLEKLLRKNITLPPAYTGPRVFHLITEYVREDMMLQALEAKKRGAVLSFEPIIDYRKWKNRDAVIEFLPHADVVSPDWPSASGFAGSDDPRKVLAWWSKSGPACVSVRNGRHGSYVWDRDHDRMWQIPIIDVERVDPTGCGNSYAGAFGVGWDKHRDAKIAGAMGTVSAAFMIRTPGPAAITPETSGEAREYLANLMDRIVEL